MRSVVTAVSATNLNIGATTATLTPVGATVSKNGEIQSTHQT